MSESQLHHFVMRADSINELQVHSMVELLRRAGSAHYTDIVLRINGKDETHQADWLKHLRHSTPTDVAVPTFHAAEEAACVHLCLDDRKVPRIDHRGEKLSLWGRVTEYVRILAPAAINAGQAECGRAEQ